MSEPECRHASIVTWGTPDNRLWACASCSRRLYPACPECVDVGHRNETHPIEREASVPDVAVLRERLEQAMDVGIYLAATPEGPRTPWQDGWNAAAIAIGDAFDAAMDAIAAEYRRLIEEASA
jgi:hypothetical protein